MIDSIRLTDKHFIDWEGDVFGYGYGSGEEHILRVLAKFFANLDDDRSYDYRVMESKIGTEQFWLLINVLCHSDIIDYGTSARYGWITVKGEILRDYLATKTLDELCEILYWRPIDYVECFRDICQCEIPCNNPLFK